MPERFSASSPLRVVIQQPALPKYRLPVFRALAAREGIALRLVYDPASRLNVAPEGLETQLSPVKTVRVGPKNLLWQSAQTRFARRGACDVLVLSWDLHYLSLIPALLRARLTGVATILWGHGYSKGQSKISKSRIWSGKLATAIQLYNRTTAQRFIEMGFDPNRVFVALNSLEQSAIEAARKKWLGPPERLGQWQKEQGVANGPVLLFCSRLLWENRCDLLLQAAAKLKNEFPDLRVFVVGDGEERENLEALARDLKIKNQVTFAGAIYDEENLAPYFLSSWAFCYPENIGLSLLHAFGYGLPAVTSDAIERQNPEIEALKHGENGLLYQHGNLDALAQSLARLCRDQQLREKMSEAALQTVREEFSIQTMVDGMEQALKTSARLVQKPRPPRA